MRCRAIGAPVRVSSLAAWDDCAIRSRCTGGRFRYVSRMENEAVLDRMQARLAKRPDVLDRDMRPALQQRARLGDILNAAAVGEQAVMSDAVKAAGQDMQQETADELLRIEHHELLARRAVEAVVFPFEADVFAIEGNEP